MTEWWRQLRSRSRLLADLGAAHLALSVLFLLLIALDSETILGINRWIKPFKFASSIAIFVWTAGWLLGYLEDAERQRRLIARGITLALVTEMVLITMQAARGTTSHFNVASGAFNAVVFSIMGIMILFNTFLVAALARLYFIQRPPIGDGLLFGIRYGLLIFICASAEGVVMVRHLAHTVGATDGGPGLPLINWSTVAGDLRVAHFVGLHALQLLPLTGWVVDRLGSAMTTGRRKTLISSLAVPYAVAFVWLLESALAGRPLLRV